MVASDSAVSIGELSVRALSGVELSGEARLPIEVLQEVSLRFDPAAVEIQRGRSTQFEVAITPSLVADRRTTVTLEISRQGFAFGTGRTTRHEVVFDADKSRETVAVANDGGDRLDGVGVGGRDCDLGRCFGAVAGSDAESDDPAGGGSVLSRG